MTDKKTGNLEGAEFVLLNGNIFTCDEEQTIVNSIAVKNGKYAYAGDNSGVIDWIVQETEIIDLGGNTVLPSFFDAHCHPTAMVELMNSVNISEMHTLDEYIEAVEMYLTENPEATFIAGNGWTNTVFDNKGPSRKILDRISDKIPIILWSEDHHSLWVNTKMLEIAGIGRDTENPDGGIIEKDDSGEPIGTLRESAADMVMKHFPEFSVKQYKDAFLEYQKMALSLGITGTFDAVLFPGSNAVAAIKELADSDELQMYFRGAYAWDKAGDLNQIELINQARGRDESGLKFKINSVKIFMDGVLEGGTAFLLEPYLEAAGRMEGYRGKAYYSGELLFSIIKSAREYGFQVHLHSIGDAATALIVKSFERALSETDKTDERHCITHLQIVAENDIQKISELGIVCIPNPYWFMKDEYYYKLQVPYLGADRAEHEYPMAGFIDQGIVVASASDFPVTINPNPLEAIQIGITRCNPHDAEYGEPLWSEERVDLKTMINSFTFNAAYANFLEDETGSIKAGKSADFIILDEDIFSINPEKIIDVRVVKTVFRGKTVYEREI